MKPRRPVIRTRRLAMAAASIAAAATCIAPAQAACESVGWDWLSNACTQGTRAFKEGSWELYVTGYDRHGRGTYTKERISELNEKAWGGGFGRTVSDERGNSHDVYFLAFKDSHFKAEYLGGYAWQARWPLSENWRAGLGVTAFVTLRSDYAHYAIPVPAILPLASLQYRKASLMASYVPRLSTKGGNGDVLFIFGKYSFE